MKRSLISLLTLGVLATLGLLIGQCSKKDVESEPIYSIVDQMPRQINNVTAIYPKDALDEGMEGVVHVKMLLDKSGNVEKAEVSVSSGMASLDSAALDAAKQCIFTPALLNGEPVRMWLYKPFNFKLNKVNK